jgi:hypothetical protein
MKIPVHQFMEFLLQDLEVQYQRLVFVQETNSEHYVKLIPTHFRELHMKTRKWRAFNLN